MRLWHQALIPYLPDRQFGGLHNEVCGMRGNGWGKKHRDVDFVWKYGRSRLVAYHGIVKFYRILKGWDTDENWFKLAYRGKSCQPDKLTEVENILIGDLILAAIQHNTILYPEHDQAQLIADCENLYRKGHFLSLSIWAGWRNDNGI